MGRPPDIARCLWGPAGDIREPAGIHGRFILFPIDCGILGMENLAVGIEPACGGRNHGTATGRDQLCRR